MGGLFAVRPRKTLERHANPGRFFISFDNNFSLSRVTTLRTPMSPFILANDRKKRARLNAASRLKMGKLDRAGATASFLCAIHCALMPLVITLLPLLGLSFLASEPVEWGLLLASASLGSLSLCLGFRQHQSRRAFVILGVALVLLVAGRISEAGHFGVWGTISMVLGGFAMMSAHLLNHRLCHACHNCNSHAHR